MAKRYSLEKRVEIWDDDSGEHLDIGPDRDGLDLLEIQDIDEKSKIRNRLVLNKQQAQLLVEALNILLGEQTQNEAEPGNDTSRD